MENKANSLTSQDWSKWRVNLVTFLAPVAILYLSAVIGVVQVPTHVFRLEDLIPTSFTIGAIVLYVLNALLDLFTKWKAGS